MILEKGIKLTINSFCEFLLSATGYYLSKNGSFPPFDDGLPVEIKL